MPEVMTAPVATGSALSRLNPFPGLRPYEEEDANWFFARGGEINELLKRLRRLHLIAVVGASGSGKSSIVKAGVLPQVRDGYLDSEWTIAGFRPGERPVANLAEATCPAGVEIAEFTRALRTGSQGLVRGLGSTSGKVLILVDQFEELFQFARRTGDAAQEEVKEFLKLLLAAAESHDVDVYVVLTMRLEWLNECASYPGLAEAINEGIYLVPQMTRRQFQQAILGPLEAAGGSITTALLGRMLNDLDNKTDQLPVLQHALMRIWERRGATDAFDNADYEAVGTFSNCLSAHAEEVYAELTDRQKKVAELLFRNITQVYQNRKIRRPQPVGEIARVARVEVAELAPVIQAFAKAGRSFLVTTQGVLQPESIVDVSHEALIRQWVRLCGWVENEADRQGRVARLETDAGEWDRDRTRFRESLYGGYELQRAEELRPTLDPASTALAFLNESRKVRVRQRVVKRGGITLALLLLLGLAFAFYWTRSQTTLAAVRARQEQADADAALAKKQAENAEQYQNVLAKKIDDAHGSPEALAAIAKEIKAKRVYVQYVSQDLPLAKSTQAQLRGLGYAVPGIEAVDPGKTGGQTQVRFFHAEDRADAGKLGGQLKGMVAGGVQVQLVADTKNVVPVGQFEVWLGPNAGGMAARQDQTHTDLIAAGPAKETSVVPVAPPPATVPTVVSIMADVAPSRVVQGRSVTLSWQATNASEVQIEGVGAQGPKGSVTLTPQQSTTYRLTAKGEGGASASSSLEVMVMPTSQQTWDKVGAAVAAIAGSPENREVQAALTRYREAYESESVDDVRKAWPSVGKNDQKNMKTVFDQFNAIRLTLNCPDGEIHIAGETATAACRQTFTYTQKGKKLPEQASANTFRLKKVGGVWVVDGIQ